MKKSRLYPAIILALAAAIVFLNVMLIRESGNADAPTQIHVIIDSSSDNRWVQFIAGMQQAAEDHNVKLNIIPTSRIQSFSEEKGLLERSILDGAGGVVLQPCSDWDVVKSLQELTGQAYIELVDTGNVETFGNIVGIVSPDHKAIGEALAEEVMTFAPKALAECVIGVILGNPAMDAAEQKMEGFSQILVEKGAKVAWKLEQTEGASSLKEMLSEQEVPDILVAMDNTGLEAAGEYASALTDPIVVIGTGSSMKAIYYLDSGVVKSIVVPEEYMMGYQSVSDLAEFVQRNTFTPKNRTVGHRVIHQDTIFTEENQGILFPIQR